MEISGIWSAIVGVLSILVTVLLVWQVLASLSIERTVNRRIKKAVDGATKLLEAKIEQNISSARVDLLLTMSMAKKEAWGRNDFTMAMEALMIALQNDTENKDYCVHYVLNAYKDGGNEINPAMYEDVGILIYEAKIGRDDREKLLDWLAKQKVLSFEHV
jgi:hypothetical protein